MAAAGRGRNLPSTGLRRSGFGADAIVYATDLHCSDQPQDPGVPVIWLTPTRNRTMPFGEIVRVSV